MKIKYCLIFIIGFINCKNNVQQQELLTYEQDSIDLKQEETTAIQKIDLQNFTYDEIARYAIATIMSQPPEIIKVTKNNEQYSVSYIRQSDLQKFEYKIKFEGNQIIWGNADGRWRDNGLDEKISFAEDGKNLKIIQTFSDGSGSTEEFKKGQ